MKMSNNFRSGRHCVFLLQVHLIFITKYRRNVFSKNLISYLKVCFEKTCLDMEAKLIEYSGEDDHIHLIVEFPPKLALSKLVNTLKGVSSRKMRKTFPFLQNYCLKKSLWSPSYFAGSCGGVTINILKNYVKNQRLPSSPLKKEVFSAQ